MTAIGSVSSGMQAMGGYGMRGMQRPGVAELANQVFSKLDSRNQGYLEQSDIASALESLGQSGASQSGASASADDVFNALDGNGDGKVSKAEFADSLKQVADQLDQQFQQMRLQAGGMPGGGGHGGMQAGGMPPPPPQNDQGLSKEQLTSRANEVSGSDSQQADFLNSVAKSFDKADTDGDGKVTFKEAMAFKQSQQASQTSATGQSGASAGSQSLEQAISQRILQLISAYGLPGQDQQQGSSASSLLASA